jgi:hypothetical protein
LAIVRQFSAVDTLLPPNFMTTQGDSAIDRGAPNAALSSKTASGTFSLMLALVDETKKKPARKLLAGLLTMSEPFY